MARESEEEDQDQPRRAAWNSKPATEFDCLECSANNPWPDGIKAGEELHCLYCGAEHAARKDANGHVALRLR